MRAAQGGEGAAGERAALKDMMLGLLVGELLGEGAYRRTYALEHSPRLVAKVDFGGQLTNAQEWHAWCQLHGTEWERWVAPCEAIDEFGGVMLQRRCRPLTDAEWAALGAVPDFLGDTGRRNWGWLEGRPVMVDYAYNHLAGRGLRRVRMVPPQGHGLPDDGED